MSFLEAKKIIMRALIIISISFIEPLTSTSLNKKPVCHIHVPIAKMAQEKI